MNRYVILIVTTLIVAGCILMIPQAVVAIFPSVHLTQLRDTEYVETVEAEGTIEEKNKISLTADYPYVPSEIFVEAGQEVKIGDVLAKVDTASTIEAISTLAAQLASLNGAQFDQILQQYKLDTPIEEEMIPQEIVANASGTISSFYLERGKLILPGQPVANISDMAELEVVASVGEAAISQVQIGDQAFITGDSLGERECQGRVAAIAPTARTRLNGMTSETVVDVEISLERTDENCKPGCHVNASIQSGNLTVLKTLPYSAIGQNEDGREYVYVFRDGKAHKQMITTGKELVDSVEVQADNLEGEWIIVPADRVARNAQRVRVAE